MEYAVVTLINKRTGWSVDMELPVKLKMKELIPKIIDVLKQYDERQFEENDYMEMSVNGKIIPEGASLADYDLWDGSKIEMLF